MRALSVDRREVDRLRARSHLGRHGIDRHAKNDGRRLAVDIAARIERIDKRRVVGQMCEEPKLDLRVVGGEKQPSLSRNESSANVPAQLSTDRNVLQVRVARGQSAR